MLPPIGFVVQTRPFLIRKGVGYSGIYVDMWREFLGVELRLESRPFSGGFEADPISGIFSGLLGEIQNSSASGIIGQMFLTEHRMRKFAFTPAFSYGKREIYERNEAPSWVFNLDAFIIFRPETLVVLLAAFVTFRICFLMINKTLNLSSNRSSLSSTFLRASFQLGLLILIMNYGGVYSGSTTVERKPVRITLSNLVIDLSQARKTMIINRASGLLESHKVELFKEVKPSSNKLQVISDPKKVLEKVCESQDYVYFDVDEFVQIYLRINASPCTFKNVDTSDMSQFASDSALRQEAFGRETPIIFYYSKHLFNRSEQERFAQIILRLYDFDKPV